MDGLDLLVYHSEQGMHSEQNQIITKCNNTGERTLSSKDNPKENLLEVDQGLKKSHPVELCTRELSQVVIECLRALGTAQVCLCNVSDVTYKRWCLEIQCSWIYLAFMLCSDSPG